MTVGIYKQTAADIMSRHVETLAERDTVHYALLLMTERQLGTIPVVAPGSRRCVGMISQRDIVRATFEQDVDNVLLPAWRDGSADAGAALDSLTGRHVGELMTRDPLRAAPDDPVVAVADRMLERGIHHLPVIDDAGLLVGLVSTMDILSGFRAS